MAIIKKYPMYNPQNPDPSPILHRYTLWFTDRVGVNVIYKDTEFFHSHPWNFVSVILWGGYKEVIKKSDGAEYTVMRRIGTIGYRKFDTFHKIFMLHGKTITLFFKSAQKTKSTKIIYNDKVVSDKKYLYLNGFTKAQVTEYINKLLGY